MLVFTRYKTAAMKITTSSWTSILLPKPVDSHLLCLKAYNYTNETRLYGPEQRACNCTDQSCVLRTNKLIICIEFPRSMFHQEICSKMPTSDACHYVTQSSCISMPSFSRYQSRLSTIKSQISSRLNVIWKPKCALIRWVPNWSAFESTACQLKKTSSTISRPLKIFVLYSFTDKKYWLYQHFLIRLTWPTAI